MQPGCVRTPSVWDSSLNLGRMDCDVIDANPRQTNRPKRALTSVCMELTYKCRLLGLFPSTCFGRLCSHVAVALALLLQHPVRGESHNQRNTTGDVATLRCTCEHYTSDDCAIMPGSSHPITNTALLKLALLQTLLLLIVFKKRTTTIVMQQ